MRSSAWVLFFFFQAEDGIRDGRVTGVQTCALPIFIGRAKFDLARPMTRRGGARVELRERDQRVLGVLPEHFEGIGDRSEERRVGKECRCGGWRWRYEYKERAYGRSGMVRVRIGMRK